MKQFIGAVLIFAVFATGFVVMAKDVGVLKTVQAFCISIFTTGIIALGAYLICDA